MSLEARLIDDLLDGTRIRSGKLHLEREVVDAHELVQHVVEICRDDLHSARLQLALDLAARRHNVDADPARLQQVLWNLIKNAIKFTPAGGILTVPSRDLDGSALGTPDTGLILEVSDTGIGIETDMLPRIFDVLISDIELPDGSGLELMWMLRASRAVSGIALSGFGSSQDIELSRSTGFAEHLTKPVDFRRLEKAIQQLAARSRVEGQVKI
ncbi:MAG: ATP-binding protein [Isosphaerales bacterium]